METLLFVIFISVLIKCYREMIRQPDYEHCCLTFQVLQDKRSQLLTSSGIPDIDELARENQNVLGAEVPPLHATDGSPEAVVIEHLNQLQLSPPSGSPVGPNQHYPHLASPVEQPPQSDGPVASLNAELSQHVENPSPSVPSDPVVLHTGANQLSGAFRNAEALSQLGVMEALPNQVVSSTPLGTRMPAKSYADPLTTELERLRKQTEQTNTAHKDTVSTGLLNLGALLMGGIRFRLFCTNYCLSLCRFCG